VKQFARGREHLLYDSDTMSFLWPFGRDDAPVLHGLATVSYNAGATTTFRMEAIGSGAGGNTRIREALGTGQVQGSMEFDGVWRAAAASSMHAALVTSWSLMFWARLNRVATSATIALVEYSTDHSPALSEINMLGVYTDQGTRRLALRWDISATTTQVVDTPVTISSGDDHFAIVREADGLEVWKNGRLAYTASSLYAPSASGGADSNWVLGGSRRYGISDGASGTTAQLVSGQTNGETVTLDDMAFFPRAIRPGKIRETYGNVLRPWDEERLISSGQYRVAHRVLVHDGSEWIDMSSFKGRDWTITAEVTNDVERDSASAKIRLRRRFGRFLDLSRTNTESSTHDGEQPLIDLRTRIKVEYAVVPTEWVVQGWEWVHHFEGFVDALDWGADALGISATDRSAALADVFRIDARRYEYGRASTTLSSEHLQVLIDDNVPRTARSGDLAGYNEWGYLGGTPKVYTPIADQWIQRYEHGGTGTVMKLLQGVADQIGWDVRYRPYHPLAEDRLTYFEPPRNLSQPLSDVRETAQGQALVSFDHPHGLQLGQTVELSDVPNFSATGRVIGIPTWNKILTDIEPTGTPAAESSGNVEHGPHFTLRASNIFDIGQVSADVADIRNHVVVKYNRENSAATTYVLAMEEDGADTLFVYLPDDTDMSVLLAGQEVTIESPDAGFSGTRAISFINGNSVELVPAGGALTGSNDSSTSGLFYSEYLAFNQVVAINTPSIARFGLRSAGVFEGSIEGIDTKQEATQLARGMLSDMANPTVDLTATITCLPHLDLHDLLALEADPLGRWTAMNVAVVGFTHKFGAVSTTEVQLRHDHPSKGRAWLNRGRGLSLDVPGNWGLPDRNIDVDIGLDVDFSFDLNPDIGPYFMSAWTPMQGRRSWLHDRTEVHFSTASSGFAANQATLVDSTRGASSSAMGGAGSRLSPGTTYFVKFRHRDKWGNLSGTHAGATTGYTLRYLTKPPGAYAPVVSSVTSWFTPGEWSSLFGVTSVTGGYDPYDNYSGYVPFVYGGGTVSTAALAYTASASFFTMPCDGVCQVEGRVGLRCTGKDTQQVSIGIFVRSDARPGSSSAPFLYPNWILDAVPSTTALLRYTDEVTGIPGFLMGSDTKTVSYWYNNARPTPLATVAYVRFSEQVSASSGDRVLVAIRPEANADDFMVHPTSGDTTASSGWVRYTVLSQLPPGTGS
jgi:hypothetical protein